MGHSPTLLAIFISVAITGSLGACIKQSLLEDILSPANAERALQILKLAAVGANRVNSPVSGLLEEINLPRFLPSPIVPAAQIASDFYQRRPPIAIPRPVSQPIIDVSPVLPDRYPAPVIQEKVYPAVPVPQPVVAPAMPVAYPAPPAPYPSAPVPLVNPFLPAASPVSAMAPPTSSLLPPVVPTQVRSNFLRKIPIPPPCL